VLFNNSSTASNPLTYSGHNRRVVNQSRYDGEQHDLRQPAEEPFHRQLSRHGNNHVINEGPNLLKKVDQQPNYTGRASAAADLGLIHGLSLDSGGAVEMIGAVAFIVVRDRAAGSVDRNGVSFNGVGSPTRRVFLSFPPVAVRPPLDSEKLVPCDHCLPRISWVTDGRSLIGSVASR
jgi:hypothetical protein